MQIVSITTSLRRYNGGAPLIPITPDDARLALGVGAWRFAVEL